MEESKEGGRLRLGLRDELWLMSGVIVSPLDLLKNPMILIAVVGLAFVVGMPYLMDNSEFQLFLFTLLFHLSLCVQLYDQIADVMHLHSIVDPEMKKEFEEHQKKSVLGGGASAANPLQNFDMAGWMAAKTSGGSTETNDGGSGRDVRRRG